LPLPPRWQWKLDRWREQLRGLFRDDAPKEARPRLCPSCKTLVGVAATRCHECGTSLTFSVAAASKALGGFLPERSPVTYIVLFINGVMFAFSMMLSIREGQHIGVMGGISGEALVSLGAKVTGFILQGEVWRLVMPIFLHGGFLHIGMNSLVLIDIGPVLEEKYGSARYLFLYIVTGIVSFIASAFWQPYGISIGASGSLMGLIGLMIAITKRHGGILAEMYRKQLARQVIYIFIFGFVIPGIDNAAHLGGLAAGYALGMMFEDREPMNAAERNRANVLGWAAALIVIASFAAMLLNYFRVTQR